MESWQPISTAPYKTVVRTIICDERGPRNVANLIHDGGLWFLPDYSVYVYYTPTHWMPLPRANAENPVTEKTAEESAGS